MRRSELLIAFVISFIAILATPREAVGQGATVRGLLSGWSYDFGGTVGRNGFKYDLENTLNTSLGPCLVTACAPGADGILGNADDPGIPPLRPSVTTDATFTRGWS